MARRTDCLNALRNSTRIFTRDEEGSFVIFSLFIFMVMIMIGGLAVDVMRYENLRTKMQNTLDRAVLAAADRDQTVAPQAVVDDYLAKAGMPEGAYTVSVTETRAGEVVTSRQVTVSAEATLGTYFMKMMGTPTIMAPAVSTAEEGINKLEISLVLDVSGSMGWGTRLPDMKNAAKTFVTQVLTDVEADQVSINVVPYSTQVNAGATLLSQFTHTNDHNYSHCVDFEASDFATAELDPTVMLQQSGHFDPWSSYQRGTFERMAAEGISPFWVCRPESGFEILPWSNNISEIHDKIDSLIANGNTSIDIGVKWGAALLDPSTRPVFDNLQSAGVVTSDFGSGRPYDHDPNDDVLKFIVVMTDGVNTTEYRLAPGYRTGNSGVWKDPDTGRYSMYSQEFQDTDGDGNWWEPVWYARNRGFSHGRYWISNIYDWGPANAFEMTWPQLWADMSLSHRAFSHFYEQYWNVNHYYNNYFGPMTWVNPGVKDNRLNSICSAAKNNDMIVFSIGFEVTDYSAGVMQNCASTPNHFYRVEGLEIEYAFQSIANQINQLKLTQ